MTLCTAREFEQKALCRGKTSTHSAAAVFLGIMTGVVEYLTGDARAAILAGERPWEYRARRWGVAADAVSATQPRPTTE